MLCTKGLVLVDDEADDADDDEENVESGDDMLDRWWPLLLLATGDVVAEHPSRLSLADMDGTFADDSGVAVVAAGFSAPPPPPPTSTTLGLAGSISVINIFANI